MCVSLSLGQCQCKSCNTLQMSGGGGRGLECAMIWLCLCQGCGCQRQQNQQIEQPLSVSTGSPFLPAQASPSFMPRLSILCLPESQETPVLGQSCHQPHCNSGHHQHSAHCDMATTLLGLVTGAHVGLYHLDKGRK